MADAPNLLFIMSDDHAAHAISAYGSRINHTPHLDRIATGGVRMDSAFCTNSICAPSRASILTGTYNHVNGVTTLDTPLDNSQWTFIDALRDSGWQTALFGKWHLGHNKESEPKMFERWRVLPGQGHYHNPVFIDSEQGIDEVGGYVTDLITDDCLNWLSQSNKDAPFALFCHHKAPHRHWEPDAKHFSMYDDVEIPYPDTFKDNLQFRAEVIQAVKMRLLDLDPVIDLKAKVPDGLSLDEEINWRYQRYIKDYLRVVASIDDNVGRLLDYLDAEGLSQNTIVVYTSDQGFFLGDHGWFDKRLMYEQSLSMPLLIRYPVAISAGQVCDDIVVNVDFGPTLLELCSLDIPKQVQGRSFAGQVANDPAGDWPTSMYYRYWMHNDSSHACPAHFGVRTKTHKLICYYNDPLSQPGANGPVNPVEWELFDLVADPLEVQNIYDAPESVAVVADLKAELARLQADVGDTCPEGIDIS